IRTCSAGHLRADRDRLRRSKGYFTTHARGAAGSGVCSVEPMLPTDTFLRARAFLVQHREDYEAADARLRLADLPEFSWALDWFDVLARGNRRTALWIARDGAADVEVSYADLSERSARVANYLRGRGVGRGDRILLMLPNVLALWEVVIAAIKL